MGESMGKLLPVDGVPDFWPRLADAARKYLILDYDGTLAPFRIDRMEAVPLEGVVDCLMTIRDRADTNLAVISGRPVDEVVKLMGELGITIVGSQGWEIRLPGGEQRTARPSLAQQRRLEAAELEAASLGLAERTERKTAGVALHTRGMDPPKAKGLADDLERMWRKGAGEQGLECRRFNGGIELRLTGTNKGTALRDLLDGEPADTFSVYIGDDETDEDAFRQIEKTGVGIRVGPKDQASNARGRLADSHAVLEFLKEWIHVTA